MSIREPFKYTLKRKNEEVHEIPPQTAKRIIPLQQIPNPPMLNQIQPKSHNSKHCPSFPYFVAEANINYNQLPVEKRAISFAELVVNQIKKKIIELYQENPEFKEVAAYTLDLLIKKTKEDEEKYIMIKEQKYQKINNEKENLIKILINERELWNSVLDIYKKNPRNVSPKNKIKYLQEIDYK